MIFFKKIYLPSDKKTISTWSGWWEAERTKKKQNYILPHSCKFRFPIVAGEGGQEGQEWKGRRPGMEGEGGRRQPGQRTRAGASTWEDRTSLKQRTADRILYTKRVTFTVKIFFNVRLGYPTATLRNDSCS